MPPQFRRSVCVGASQITPTSAPSSHIQQLPSQPNIISTSTSNTTTTTIQPRILLSPLYSGNSASSIQQPQTAILSSQTNMLTSPLASVHSDNSVGPSVQQHQTQNLGVPVLNITNTNLTTSPVELSDNSIINQTRSPNSIYNNSLLNDTHPITITTSPLPAQNPNRLMVQTNVRSPIRNQSITSNSLLVLSNNQHNAPSMSIASPSTIQYGAQMTSSPVVSQNLVDSPLDMSKKEDIIESTKTIPPRPIKRKRSYYGQFPSEVAANFLKATQSIKRSKMAMTISPEELNFQPNTPNSRPLEQNNKKENSSSIQLLNKTMVSPRIQISRPSEDNDANNKNFPDEGQSFPYIDKGKYEEVSSSESESSSHPFRKAEKSMTSNVENPFLNTIETIPNSNIRIVMDPLDNNVTANSEEIIASSLLLAANNSTSLTLIPVSPPYTPK